MDIFGKNKKIEMQGQIDRLLSENLTLKKELASLNNIKAVYNEEKKQLVKKHEIALNQMKQAFEAEKQSVAKKVNKELSKIGVSDFVPEEISTEPQLSPYMIVQKFTSMPESTEKHEFFERNEKIISQYMKQDFNK